MASSVRLDASQTKLQNQTNQFAASNLSTSKSISNNSSTYKQHTGAILAPSQTSNPSTNFLDQPYRRSPTKQQPVDNGYLVGQGKSGILSTSQIKFDVAPSNIVAKGTEGSKLAAELFRSSEEEYEQEGDLYDETNSAEDQEEGGDPTCGDSDFEPAEQSTRGQVFHSYKMGSVAGASSNFIQNDFDDRLDLHDQAGYSYQFDKKLNDEHDIEKYGAYTTYVRERDNSDSVYHLRDLKKSYKGEQSYQQNQKPFSQNYPTSTLYSRYGSNYNTPQFEKGQQNQADGLKYDRNRQFDSGDSVENSGYTQEQIAL